MTDITLMDIHKSKTLCLLNYRHPNFDIGTTEMIKVSANATCCVKKMDFKAIGVSKEYKQVISVFSDGSSCGTKRFVSNFSFILTFFAFILINANESSSVL